MTKQKLTKRSLAAIKEKAKGKSDFTMWDLQTPGFGLRLRNSTMLSWVLQYRMDGKDWRIKIGDGSMSCAKAREQAEELKGQVQTARNGNGIHPGKVRDQQKAYVAPPKEQTFGDFVQQYLEARKAAVRDSTFDEISRYLKDGFKALSTLNLGQIERRHIAVELNSLAKASGPASANRARSSISRFYKWAIGEGLCESNPVRDTNLREDENKARDRVLSDSEIATVWLSCPDSDYGNILKLILLTGCRREEIGGLLWSEIDPIAKTITLPGSRTKNGLDFIVPLSDTALSMLSAIERRGDCVFGRLANGFSGWSRSKRELDAVAKIEAWTVHDLRRTVATKLAESPVSIQPHIIEACLNHISGHKGGVAGTYNRATYQSEKKDALDRWGHHLKTIVAQATGANVTALRKSDRRKPGR
jgi:integrase